MTQLALVLLAVAAGAAIVDWIGVVHSNARVRAVAKPAVIVLLIAVALALRPHSEIQRRLFVVALLLSLAGDVLLLQDRRFSTGLAAFLGAHLAYGAGFLVGGIAPGRLALAGLAVLPVSAGAGGRVVLAVAGGPRRALLIPVTIYVVVISSMVALAGGSGNLQAIIGAGLFYCSDGLIAWNRFVRPLSWSGLPIIALYHLGQAALTISLAQAPG
ncbi:MAG: hypothetical protein NVS9B1_01280 [Candidatus Dormibacteraceae bacterium]